jgi:type IV pilus assembly protein PilM
MRSREISIGRTPAGVTVTTTSVSAVHPASGRHGVVELPPGAVIDGEIADPGVVSAALRQLWKDAGIPTHHVVVGVNNQNIVARSIVMPDLTDKELRTALRFELADMVPFPVPRAMLDLRRIEATVNERGVAQARVMAIAADKDMLRSFVAVARAAGLRTVGIDYLPFALVRAVASVRPSDAVEVIIDIADETLTVVVHQGGIVRFTRSVISAALTSSQASEIEAELVFIEQYRRRAAGGEEFDASAERFDPLVEAIRGTVEFYTAQAGALPVESIVLTGDAARATTVAVALKSLTDVPIGLVDPLDHESPYQAEPFFRVDGKAALASSWGLAQPGDDHAHGPARLSLLPDRETPSSPKDLAIRAGAAAAIAAVVLGAVTWVAGPDVDGAQRAQDQAAARVGDIRHELKSLKVFQADAADSHALEAIDKGVGAWRVDWNRLLTDIRLVAPSGSALLSVSGTGPTRDQKATTPGQIEIVGRSASQASIASWLEGLDKIPGIAEASLTTANSKQGVDTTFTIAAKLDDQALVLAGIQPGQLGGKRKTKTTTGSAK